MTTVRRLKLTLLLAAAMVVGLVVASLLAAGEDAGGDPDPDDEELTVPEDVTVIGVEQGVVSRTSSLDIGLSSSDGELASASFMTPGETYGESRMPLGRRVVVGGSEIELALLDEDYAEFWVRDHDRDPTEPVGLRPPGGTREYPPGFSVQLRAWDGEVAHLDVAVRTDPDARTIEGWEEQDLDLTEGQTVEVHGYRIAWHDKADDELLVTLHGPDGRPVVEVS